MDFRKWFEYGHSEGYESDLSCSFETKRSPEADKLLEQFSYKTEVVYQIPPDTQLLQEPTEAELRQARKEAKKASGLLRRVK